MSNVSPIIFIHIGDPGVLPFALSQVVRSNKANRIILISDLEASPEKSVELHPIAPYATKAATLPKLYRHYSPYDPAFELFCIQRWFILAEFMKTHALSSCFHSDSDNLIYSDITSLSKTFADFELTLSNRYCGHNSYINSLAALDAFCEFVTLSMSISEELFRKNFEAEQDLRRGLLIDEMFPFNDMRLWHYFSQKERFMIGDSAHIWGNGSFDHDIATPQGGFLMKDGAKKITWKNGSPYGYHERLKREIKLHTLHFKGGAKPLMEASYLAGLKS